MVRKYLINIHRFYRYFYPNSFDSPIMPSIVAGVTLTSVLAIIDLIFYDGFYIKYLKGIAPFMVTIPAYIVIFIIFFWYKKRLPKDSELNPKNGMWMGIVISIFSIIGFLVASIIYLD